jgi:hypothetical protein
MTAARVGFLLCRYRIVYKILMIAGGECSAGFFLKAKRIFAIRFAACS